MNRHPQVLAVARRACAALPEVRHCRADALALPHHFGTFEVAIYSQALHHFAPADAVALLRSLRRMTRRSVIVIDIVRSRRAL